MTAYAASLTVATTSGKLTVVPSSTYQIRISRVEVCVPNIGAGGGASYTVNVYPGSTPTGGSTINALAMRSGAPAATAVAKSGTTLSGTNSLLHTEAVAVPNVTGNEVGTMNSNYTFPFDLILSSGSTFVVTWSSLYPMFIVVYFEELRLGWNS